MWTLWQLQPESPAYTMAFALRICGPLDCARLEAALNRLVERHASLRTTFALDGQDLVRDVAASVPCRLRPQDIASLPRTLHEHLLACARRPFDLQAGPVFRAELFRCNPQEHVFLFALHHIAGDLWSLGIVLEDLFSLYASPTAPSRGGASYDEFVDWQATHLGSAEGAQSLSYWRQTLLGDHERFILPHVQRVAAPVNARGDSMPFKLSLDLSRQLQNFAETEGTTLYAVLLATFASLLGKLGQREDVLVCSPTSGRPQPKFWDVVGLFSNSILLRALPEKRKRFRDLLNEIAEAAAAGVHHSDIPIAAVARALNQSLDPLSSPLFQTMFAWEQITRFHHWSPLFVDEPERAVVAGELTLRPYLLPQQEGQFDLHLTMGRDGDAALFGTWKYRVPLLDRAGVERIHDSFCHLLQTFAEKPEKRLASVSTLSNQQQHQRRVWNDTARPYDLEPPLQALFEQQAAARPDAPALVTDAASVTYRALDERANQLAQLLRRYGVGPDVIVAVCANRSIELVIALYAVLKAGGAYLPLDPLGPRERAEHMLAEARPAVILTDAAHEDWAALDIPLVRIDDPRAFANERAPSLGTTAGGDRLAYVIYTSGSTGRPKGVMVSHRAVVNRLLWMQEAYPLSEADTVMQKTPFTFDVSVWELFWPLMVGARMAIAKPGGHRDPGYLADFIERTDTTTIHFVPSMLETFIATLSSGRCRSLSRIFASGEALSQPLAQRCQRHFSAELHNLYGPTEAAVDVAFWHCRRGDDRSYVPIGRPIANCEIHLLGVDGQPVPVGVAGELYIGGVCLARGYLNQPELTTERFVRHPFASTAGARLYKTGDLARYDDDGVIEFLGRTDTQVKLRGFRIELGEIEAVLRTLSGVRDAVVVLRAPETASPQLVAYLLCDGVADESGLRAALADKLPEYMLPRHIVFLTEFPLTASGKVDRRALPAPEAPAIRTPPEHTADPIEVAIAQIWCELLGLPSVGRMDDFFSLGGDSLLAVQAALRVQAELRMDVSAGALFDARTPAALARRLRATQSDTDQAFAFEADAVLDEKLQPTTSAARASYTRVLLTGGTGFVGAFTLAALARDGVVVECLVREQHPADAKRKLRRALEGYGLWRNELDAAIIPLCGDLATDRLGLSERAFVELGVRNDAIFHVGALVSFSQPYHALRAPNVCGTREILRLACAGGRPLHYLSTASIFDSARYAGCRVDETAPPGSPAGLQSGYAQSKWVAEQLVREAARRGLPTVIYRLGMIAGDSRTGASNTADLFHRMIAGCVALSVAPEVDFVLPLTPVDFAAEAIVRLSREPLSLGCTFHLTNARGLSISALLEAIGSRGFPVRRLPFAEWLEVLAAGPPDNPLLPLLPFLTHDAIAHFVRDGTPVLDTTQTDTALARVGLICPAADADMIGLMLDRSLATAPQGAQGTLSLPTN